MQIKKNTNLKKKKFIKFLIRFFKVMMDYEIQKIFIKESKDIFIIKI